MNELCLSHQGVHVHNTCSVPRGSGAEGVLLVWAMQTDDKNACVAETGRALARCISPRPKGIKPQGPKGLED